MTQVPMIQPKKISQTLTTANARSPFGTTDMPKRFKHLSVTGEVDSFRLETPMGIIKPSKGSYSGQFDIHAPDGEEIDASGWAIVTGKNPYVEVTIQPPDTLAPSGIAFLDLETTGLDPLQDEIWEFALITEHGWTSRFVEHDASKITDRAAEITGYHDRYDPTQAVSQAEALRLIYTNLAGLHLTGMVPSFDDEFIRQANLKFGSGASDRTWHYHLVDVEALIAGKVGIKPPWTSDDLSIKMNVDPQDYDRHTALGDAIWARDLYMAVMK